VKPIADVMEGARSEPESKSSRGARKNGSVGVGMGPAATPEQIAREIKRLEAAMLKHARELEFEEAAACRDAIDSLKARLLELA